MKINDIFSQFNTPPFLFVGSGISRRYLNLPDWKGLLSHFTRIVSDDDYSFSYYENLATSAEYTQGVYPKIASLLERDYNKLWFKAPDIRTISEEKLEDVKNNGLSPFKAEIASYIQSISKLNDEYINEFTKEKLAICFTGVETNEKQNLENFSKCILEYVTKKPANTSFDSFQTALEYVFELAEEERIALVIDEYPYVARASKSLASTLQLLIDKYKDTSKLFLILCGSSMSYMEDQVLAYKAPLYGRRTAQFKVQPFEFQEACKYFTNLSDEDKALAYGIVGGTPQYLLQLNDKLSIEDNIKNTYLNPASSIYEEPQNLLKQEVREPAIYNAIIAAIATGYSKMSEISTKVGEDTSVCATYIKNLISLGIVKKETPFGEAQLLAPLGKMAGGDEGFAQLKEYYGFDDTVTADTPYGDVKAKMAEIDAQKAAEAQAAAGVSEDEVKVLIGKALKEFAANLIAE